MHPTNTQKGDSVDLQFSPQPNNSEQKSGNNLLVTPTKATQTPVNTSPPTDERWGCDYVAFTLHVSPDSIDVSDAFWVADNRRTKDPKVTYDNFKGSLLIGNATVNLYLMPLKERLKIGFNPSRIFSNAASAMLCEPEKVQVIIQSVLEALEGTVGTIISSVDIATGEVIKDEHWAQQIRLSRIDLSRDFYIPTTYAAELERAWNAITPDPRHTKNNYNRASNNSFSLYHSTKSQGSDKIYNKTAQLDRHWKKKNTETAIYRFESRLQNGRLKTHELQTLNNLSNERAWKALQTRWSKSRFAISIRSADTTTSALGGYSNAKRQRIIGVLEEAVLGRFDLSERGNQRIAKEIRMLGLVLGIDTIRSGEVCGFVDLNTGTVVQQVPTI